MSQKHSIFCVISDDHSKSIYSQKIPTIQGLQNPDIKTSIFSIKTENDIINANELLLVHQLINRLEIGPSYLKFFTWMDCDVRDDETLKLISKIMERAKLIHGAEVILVFDSNRFSNYDSFRNCIDKIIHVVPEDPHSAINQELSPTQPFIKLFNIFLPISNLQNLIENIPFSHKSIQILDQTDCKTWCSMDQNCSYLPILEFCGFVPLSSIPLYCLSSTSNLDLKCSQNHQNVNSSSCPRCEINKLFSLMKPPQDCVCLKFLHNIAPELAFSIDNILDHPSFVNHPKFTPDDLLEIFPYSSYLILYHIDDDDDDEANKYKFCTLDTEKYLEWSGREFSAEHMIDHHKESASQPMLLKDIPEIKNILSIIDKMNFSQTDSDRKSNLTITKTSKSSSPGAVSKYAFSMNQLIFQFQSNDFSIFKPIISRHKLSLKLNQFENTSPKDPDKHLGFTIIKDDDESQCVEKNLEFSPYLSSYSSKMCSSLEKSIEGGAGNENQHESREFSCDNSKEKKKRQKLRAIISQMLQKKYKIHPDGSTKQLFKRCNRRLKTVCESYLKDVDSSDKKYADRLLDLVIMNIDQVVRFEKKRNQ